MLRSIKQLGRKLGATDGEIGQAKDFYFEDQHGLFAMLWWIQLRGCQAARYTFSPAFGTLHQDGDALLVKLTRD